MIVMTETDVTIVRHTIRIRVRHAHTLGLTRVGRAISIGVHEVIPARTDVAGVRDTIGVGVETVVPPITDITVVGESVGVGVVGTETRIARVRDAIAVRI